MSTFNNTFLSDATVITFGVYLSNESRSSPDRPSAMPPAYEDPALETPPASPVTEPVFHPEDEGTGTDSTPDTEPHQQATAVEAANWLLLNQASASGLPRPATAATALRKMLLETKELIICPGVYDGLSARTAIEVGFDALYMVIHHNMPLPFENGPLLTCLHRLELAPQPLVLASLTSPSPNSMRCGKMLT